MAVAVAVAVAQPDGHQAATDGIHMEAVNHMVNMAHTANPLHNKLHTLDITKSPADNSLLIHEFFFLDKSQLEHSATQREKKTNTKNTTNFPLTNRQQKLDNEEYKNRIPIPISRTFTRFFWE